MKVLNQIYEAYSKQNTPLILTASPLLFSETDFKQSVLKTSTFKK